MLLQFICWACAQLPLVHGKSVMISVVVLVAASARTAAARTLNDVGVMASGPAE